MNWIGKSSELKLHCFCLFDAYSMPKDMCSAHLQDHGLRMLGAARSKIHSHPKSLGTAKVYFVCHIGLNIQIFFVFIGLVHVQDDT